MVNQEMTEVEDEPCYTSEMLGRYCTLERKLGRGSQGSVWLASSGTAQRTFAVKLLKASQEAMGEIAAYRTIGAHSRHSNLLQANLLIAEDRCVNLILESCQTDLLEYVLKHPNGIEEHLVSRWSRQLCSATAHLHQIDVMHLDIKLENIMLQGPPGKEVAKLGDFGLSDFGGRGKLLTKMCGSGIYRAPEVSLALTRSPYDGRAADVWSIGVCIFVMTRGCFPFAVHVPINMLKEHREITALHCTEQAYDEVAIARVPSVLSSQLQRCKMSPALLEVLDSVLSLEPEGRPPASALLQFPWFACDDLLDDSLRDDSDLEGGYSTPSSRPGSPSKDECHPPYFIDARRKRRRKSHA